jgi:GT2 family glycosyltransferase
VIVVDDGSTDGTDGVISREFPNVTVIKGSGNLYWTASVNIGIRKAMNDGALSVITMNNDGYPARDFLENMSKASEHRPDSLLCAYEIDADTNKPYYGGELINWTWASSKPLLPRLKEQARVGLHRVSVAPGRGLFIPSVVFQTIGLFAEKQFPHYMADYDFACLAIRNGFSVYCNYDAKLYTYSQESGDKELLRKKSFLNYYKHLFDIKGGGNLKNYILYTFRNSPPVLVPLHLIKGICQRLFGYFLH